MLGENYLNWIIKDNLLVYIYLHYCLKKLLYINFLKKKKKNEGIILFFTIFIFLTILSYFSKKLNSRTELKIKT